MKARDQLSDVLGEFARTMVTDFPIQAIADQLVHRIVPILPVSAAGVTLTVPGRDSQYIAASGDTALTYEQLQTDLNDGPCLLAYETGLPVVVPDLRSEDRFPRFTAQALQSGLRAVYAFPLHHGSRKLGTLSLYREHPGALSAASAAVAQTLADVTAAYLINAEARDELRRFSQQAQHAALHDALTGLPNRTLMMDRIDHAFAGSSRTHKALAVIYIDLDRFKAVNDTYGHRAGDTVLIAVAERLTAVLRLHDTVARLSGDEFVALCEDLDTPAQATAIGARIQKALDQPYELAGMEATITASVGIAYADHGSGYGPDRLLDDADAAMYKAKRRGADPRRTSAGW